MTLAPAEVEKNIKSVTGPKTLGRAFLLSSLSGLLLTLAFPRWGLWLLAWVSLVPLFRALDMAKDRFEAFGLGFTAGFVFFLLSISWLRHVTVFGLFFVVTMLAVYWGVFGVLYFGCRGAGTVPKKGGETPPLLLAAIWVALEFIRSELPVWGFGWNLLGSSQSPNLWVVQLASLGGVTSVSFLIFLGNVFAHTLTRKRTQETLQNGFVFLLLLGATSLFGWSRVQAFNPQSFFRVSVLQGNIPQLLKWDEDYKREILRIYLNLTRLASFDASQVIVWPEAAFPGFLNQDPLGRRVERLVRQIGIPLIVGSPHAEAAAYYNSSYLIDASGKVAGRYDKIRLVPFGEYVPWKPVFGFLEPYAYALGVSDFSPGRDFTVFRLEGSGPRFSTLICFEDVFPNLARQFVDRGADFLFVMTNDAWFGHSSAPYQHLQASQLRAIENGVSIVRAANTGVSAFITPLGEVVEKVHNQDGKDTFVMGGTTYPVVLAKEETLFRKGGWLFPYACLAVLIAWIPFHRFRPLALVFFLLLTSACVRIQGGGFVAKKDSSGEPKVHEVSFDSDKLLNRQ